MIQFTRTACAQAGKMGDALAFAREVSDHLEKKYDRKLQVMLPVGGNPNRIAWSTTFPSLAALEQFQGQILTDAQYMGILAKAGACLMSGATTDEMWMGI